jgi:hypothetical protein
LKKEEGPANEALKLLGAKDEDKDVAGIRGAGVD